MTTTTTGRTAAFERFCTIGRKTTWHDSTHCQTCGAGYGTLTYDRATGRVECASHPVHTAATKAA